MRASVQRVRISCRAGQQCLRDYATKNSDLSTGATPTLAKAKPPSEVKGSPGGAPKGSPSASGATGAADTSSIKSSNKEGSSSAPIVGVTAVAAIGGVAYWRYAQQSAGTSKAPAVSAAPPSPAPTPPPLPSFEPPPKPSPPKAPTDTGTESTPIASTSELQPEESGKAVEEPTTKAVKEPTTKAVEEPNTSSATGEKATVEEPPPAEAPSGPPNGSAAESAPAEAVASVAPIGEPSAVPPAPQEEADTANPTAAPAAAVQAESAQAPATVPDPAPAPPTALPLPSPSSFLPGAEEGRSGALRPDELVLAALQKGAAVNEEFAAVYKAMQCQAEVDAEAFQRREAELEARAAEQLRQERHRTQTLADFAASLKDALVLQKEVHEEKLKAAAEAAAAELETQLEAQAVSLEAAAAASAQAERHARLAQLDSVRQSLNVLQAALHAQAYLSHTSHAAHKLALGAFQMDAALQKGEPYMQALARLSQSRPHDPLVAAALRSTHADVAAAGAVTRTQLIERFVDVKKAARDLALVPASGAGPVALMAARLATFFRVEVPSRTAMAAGASVVGGIEDVLARTQRLLAQGDLVGAAQMLEDGTIGTAAAPIVSDWIKAVRARALAEQTATLLHAHATTQSAGLA